MKWSIVLLVVLVVVLTMIPSSMVEAEGSTCPAGNVKAEVPMAGYEYNDGTGGIWAEEFRVCWAPKPGYEVVGVCVKIGGPGGGSLINPDPSQNCWVNDTPYAISHVVLYTRPLPTLTSTPVVPTSTPVVPTETPVVPTSTSEPTETPIPTSTPVVPTSTPVVPTETPVVPTVTPVTPTETPVIPTSTPEPTETPIPTSTPVSPTETPVVPTETPVVPTSTPVVPTATPERPTLTATPIPLVPTGGEGADFEVRKWALGGFLLLTVGLFTLSFRRRRRI